MSASRHRVYFLSGFAVLLLGAFAVLLLRPSVHEQRVVFADGSCFIIRKVSYGKNNVYWHDPVRRIATDWVPYSAGEWAGRTSLFGADYTNACILSAYDHLVVFGDFHLVPATARAWEFTGVDGDGNESSPLETPLLNPSFGRSACGPCILASGKNIPNRWPIAVRIYERGTNGLRKLLVQLPAERAPR